MIAMTAAEIAQIVNGSLTELSPDALITEIPCIDSRKATTANFFVAFKGEISDGNDFAESAIQNGARFALVTRPISGPSILVADVGQALIDLTRASRLKMKTCKVIGITGSQGKTTTKDFLNHLLSSVGITVAPVGNLNNEIGVPLTLLSCNEETNFCVLEMGARHMGDIAKLVEVARPDIGVVLNVGRAHLGEFGSRSNIAKTKGEMITSLLPGTIAVLGNYDEFTRAMAATTSNKVLNFGERSDCDVRATDVELREGRAHFDLVTPEGRQAVGLQLLGLHQVSNALAAAAVATALGIPIETIAAALSTATASSKWRMELHEVGGLLLINDAYNASPDSMAAALRTLALLSQERGGLSWAFLGKMNELGESAGAEHEAIGRLVSEIGIDHLVQVGTKAFWQNEEKSEGREDLGETTTMHHFDSVTLASALATNFSAGDVVLVKASRSEKLEELAEQLLTVWKERIA
ncbi:MAG: UDP-N-acetylmuramoyl-tripeptide--D-alanyl-D-alanine ligase [Actinomycetes bacterium]